MTYLPQFVGFAVPHSDDVLGKKRYDEIFAVTADRHLSSKRESFFSEGLDGVKG